MIGGTLIASCGFCLCAVAQELWHLYPTSIIVGLGSGIVMPISQMHVQAWNPGRRALASAMGAMGNSGGAFFFGATLLPVAKEFGVRGTFIYLAMLNLCLLGTATA